MTEEEEEQEDVEDMEEEFLECGLCGGPCDPHPDDPQDQDPICQPCRDKPVKKPPPTKPTDPATYFDHIRSWEKKRETVLVESPTGFVFAVVKLSGMETAKIFDILGIDLESDKAVDIGVRFHKRNLQLLDEFIQPNIRSPVLHTSDTPLETIPKGEVRVDKLHKVDIDAIMTNIMWQVSGGDIPKNVAKFLNQPNLPHGRKTRKKRGRNSPNGHSGQDGDGGVGDKTVDHGHNDLGSNVS